ncbi:MAG: 16S rRNA (guanine(527)-N(7))-methyltransferase RsmG [Calothrix sp. MO_192.B10]|nr:16S rRNA (guanine(527)-N(7))-methyltransferase RsmG [Calothrix sp. MO_192.B10]
MNNSILPSLPEMADIWQQTLNWQPTSQQQIQFQRLYELILQGNQKLNLTRITEPQEFWEKHLWDSLRGVAPLLNNSNQSTHSKEISFIDIGTGAGFPGIPVAIAVNQSTVKLLDSTHKKIHFIEQILPELGLNNVTAITGRAEEVGQNSQYREQYDVALIRAVGNPSVCAEYALPLVKKGGLAIIYRGNWTAEETTNMESAVKQLGGVIENIEQFITPLSQSIRHCLYLKKVANTPVKFPRAVGVPSHKPL